MNGAIDHYPEWVQFPSLSLSLSVLIWILSRRAYESSASDQETIYLPTRSQPTTNSVGVNEQVQPENGNGLGQL